MKITVCDVCKNEGKLTETLRYLKVKNHPDLRIDVCDNHMTELRSRYPKVTAEYVQYVYRIHNMIELSLDDAQRILTPMRVR